MFRNVLLHRLQLYNQLELYTILCIAIYMHYVMLYRSEFDNDIDFLFNFTLIQFFIEFSYININICSFACLFRVFLNHSLHRHRLLFYHLPTSHVSYRMCRFSIAVWKCTLVKLNYLERNIMKWISFYSLCWYRFNCIFKLMFLLLTILSLVFLITPKQTKYTIDFTQM